MFGKKKKHNILILGNNGMLGHELYEKFIKLSSIKESNIGTVIGIDIEDGIDLTKRHALGNYMATSIHFDYCINCVAYTNTKSAETTQEGRILDYKLNALAPKYIAESCRYWKTKLIHISTDYVFSEKSADVMNPPCPFIADNEPFPINNYGVHKLLGEKFIQEEFGKNSKNYSICRVSWLYGMWNSKSFIHKFLKNVSTKLKADPTAKITMTSNEISVPTSVEYVIECIYDIIYSNKFGIFHTVPSFNNSGVSRHAFAQYILKSFISIEEPDKLYTINGKALKDIELIPVEYNGYQPKYSALKNDYFLSGIGSNITWINDLDRFMKKNIDKLFKEIV